MIRPWLGVLIFVSACGDRQQAALPPPGVLDRTEAGVVPTACNLGATCPEAVAGLDPAKCISDAAPFVVEIDDTSGAILDAKIDEAALVELDLAEGRWWTIFADPGGSCAKALTVIVPVEVSDAVE